MTCKAPKSVKRGARNVRITCSVRLAPRARIALRRTGRVVARGVVSADGRVVLTGRRPARGRYTLAAGTLRIPVKVR